MCINNIKLFAVDIDGVILKDTFSPVLRKLILQYGGSYTADVERNVFSRNQSQAAQYVIQLLGLKISIKNLIDEYFALRADYMAMYGGGLIDGAIDMLDRLASLDVPMVCYGGLQDKQIDPSFDRCRKYFDGYICTNEIRPGMDKICSQYKLAPNTVLFIDDVATVAETCRNLGTGFIGLPSNDRWSWQRQAMQVVGVRYCLSHIDELSDRLVRIVNQDVSACFLPKDLSPEN